MLQHPIVTTIALCLLGYLTGSVSFSILITKLFKGGDVRDGGSGHATTTNTIRQVGWAAGGAVFLLDFLKGVLPVYIATIFAPYPWVVPVVGALAVAGHCWPIFWQFKGGMGLATAGGGIFLINPLYSLIGIGILVAIMLMIHHSARAAVITGIILAPVYYFLGMRGMLVWITAAVGAVIAIRFLIDWNRQYRELWLDREQQA